MKIFNRIFGRPLKTEEREAQELSVFTGVPALGLDALASTAYGPEAALMILLPAGLAGLHYFSIISVLIVVVLVTLYLSYRQTAAAYPKGGGAYIVASDNLGKRAGLWAAIALLLDYLLNVAVGISAGVGAFVSAIPMLQPWTLSICLVILATLTIINLRGVRESGLAFAIPAFAFVIFLGVAMLIGVFDTLRSAGYPHPVIPPPAPPAETAKISTWLLLGAFANGLTAMTGVEAVSNAVPLFRKPVVKNAQWTLTIIVLILGLFLLGLAYLCPSYHIIAMDESKPGYQTIFSQLVEATTGRGVFYYLSILSIFIVLTYSAQTSFVDFPRVCRLLAEDHFLPHFFAERGRRLVFSLGIIVLACCSAVLLIIFKGITANLIPLFAVGAFSAFLFSQIGMVVHWLRKKHESKAMIKLFFNALGVVSTFIALVIIILAKFMEGAWMVIIAAPLLVYLFTHINRHYSKIRRIVDKPLELKISEFKPLVVIVPIRGWDTLAEKAIRFALLTSEDVTAIFVSTNDEEAEQLKTLWNEKVEKPAKDAGFTIPQLVIINSPYRRIYQPILDYVNKVKKEKPDRFIAVVIPELVEAHWYEVLLHNIRATGLRTLLFLERDQRTVVIATPWYLR